MPRGGARSVNGQSVIGHVRVVRDGDRTVVARPLDSGVKPWEQQPDETHRSYAMFIRYRDLAPETRSLRRAHDAMGDAAGSLRQWEYYCSKWSWVERATAFDMEQDRQKVQERMKEAREMGVRQARQAQLYAQGALLPVTALVKKMRDNPEFIENLLTTDPHAALAYVERMARVFEIATKIERTARGEPEGITQINHNVADTGAVREAGSAILEDPETAVAAAGLLERLHRVG